MRDISDAELGRLVAIGVGIGVPFLFLVSMGIGVAAGLSPGVGALIALIPTFFGGWFYGGTLFVLRASDRNDVEELPVDQPEERETPRRHAA